MKKLGSILLCVLLAAVLTSCQSESGGGAQSSSAAGESSAPSSQEASSQEDASQDTSQESSAAAPSSSPASREPSSSKEEVSQASQPEQVYESGADYTMEFITMDPADVDGVSVTMTVPSLGGSAAQKYGLGGELNRMVSGVAESVIRESGYSGGELTLESETPYYSEKLISIVMTVDYTAEGMAYPVHRVETKNLRLESSGFSDFASVIEDNQAFRDALTANNATAADDETLLSGVGDASVYFTETGVGIAVPVPHAVGDTAQVVIPYSQTADFRTDDPAWECFQ